MQRLNTSVSILNNSTSKQRFSFSRQSRFKSEAKWSTDSFYDLPPLISNRSTSFGYGNKEIGLKYQKHSPSPQAYNIQSSFEKSLKHRKGFSFGEGRQDMQITGPLSDMVTKKYIPSPNQYLPKTQSSALDITLKSRLQDKSCNHLKKNPGPGTYNWEQMGKPNYYITSRHQNKINFKISNSPKPESVLQGKGNPRVGPGTYEIKSTQINKQGVYFQSKIKNSLASRFSKQARPEPVIKHLLKNPSPTRYSRVSQFDS